MRDPEIIEKELIDLGAIIDDETKVERIVVWCATHPDEVPTAMRILLGRAPARAE